MVIRTARERSTSEKELGCEFTVQEWLRVWPKRLACSRARSETTSAWGIGVDDVSLCVACLCA